MYVEREKGLERVVSVAEFLKRTFDKTGSFNSVNGPRPLTLHEKANMAMEKITPLPNRRLVPLI